MHPKLFCRVPADVALQFRPEILELQANLELVFPASAIDRLGGGHSDFVQLTDLLCKHQLLCTAHAPFDDLCPGGFDPQFRSLTRHRLHQFMNLSRELQPCRLVFHTGYSARRFGYRRSEWLNHAVATFRYVIGQVWDPSVAITVENVYEKDGEILIDLVDAIDHPQFGICFDLAHAELWSDWDYATWFERIGDRLMHIHLSDHHGERDEHLGLGEGDIPYREFFREMETRKLDPTMTIEVNGIESIRRTISFLQSVGWPR